MIVNAAWHKAIRPKKKQNQGRLIQQPRHCLGSCHAQELFPALALVSCMILGRWWGCAIMVQHHCRQNQASWGSCMPYFLQPGTVHPSWALLCHGSSNQALPCIAFPNHETMIVAPNGCPARVKGSDEHSGPKNPNLLQDEAPACVVGSEPASSALCNALCWDMWSRAHSACMALRGCCIPHTTWPCPLRSHLWKSIPVDSVACRFIV